MQIIPVADIKNGQIVLAIKGNRSSYQPVQSNLCSTSEPADVVEALLKTSHANTIYLADLDAIEQQSDNNSGVIIELAQKNNTISFWLDVGFTSTDQLNQWREIPNIRPVIGTENHTQLSTLLSLLKSDHILSLDFKNNQLCGPDDILNRKEDWPDDVLVMSLDKVGANAGPDLDLLSKIKTFGSDARLYAAGGVRNQSDLELLSQIGVEGVLIASALHKGSLMRDI